MSGRGYYVFAMSRCADVPMSWRPDVPMPTLTFYRTTWILNGCRWNSGRYSLPWTDELVTFWAKLYQGQGSRKFESKSNQCCHVANDISNITVHTTHGLLRPQSWRVHYTHAAAEASCDRPRLSSLSVWSFWTICVEQPPHRTPPVWSLSFVLTGSAAPSDCLLLGAVYKFACLLTYLLLICLLNHQEITRIVVCLLTKI